MSRSKTNKQEQVKVVIRLKPDDNQNTSNQSVFVSDQNDNQLIVEANGKRQIFVFDHIAPKFVTQMQIYRMIGQECVQHFFEGYNCCIFAYGQTGAGKTYSILGNLSDIQNNIYCQSRGILPRLLQQVFEQVKNREGQKQSITCSYMEIYNEQIFDLLSHDKRMHSIREDAKRGVFVQGLIEKQLISYRSAMELLLQGQKSRKLGSTMMNTQSSRSHAIFSMVIESEIASGQVIISKKAKLHIVDLAGSERIKHTNVDGERLREGCNINKSLHVLGNVINSLVQSAKKKKHIPYRDSKLTHYLKDSLGGNSITKLLANVRSNKQYLGDTLSTLMFAKRAKFLKTNAGINESTAENFDQLRQQVRRLREELAQARYFKTYEKTSTDKSIKQNELQISFQKINVQQIDADSSQKVLKVLQENQSHFKALIDIYEEHMKTCLSSCNIQRKQNINVVKQWKNLQKRNISLTRLVKQLPSFTKIYKQNILLKQQLGKVEIQKSRNEEMIKSRVKILQTQDITLNKPESEEIINYYETLIKEIEDRFKQCLEVLQKNQNQLENQCKLKDKKIKDLKRKKQYPPNIIELKDQNQYLHLIILNLENQIAKLNQNQDKLKLEFKQFKYNIIKKQQSKDYGEFDENQLVNVYERLLQIKKEAERQADTNQKIKTQMEAMIYQFQTEIVKLKSQNAKLFRKYSRSKSKRMSSPKREKQMHSHSQAKYKKSMTLLHQFKETIMNEPTNINNSFVLTEEQIRNMQQTYTKQIINLKIKEKNNLEEIINLKKQIQNYQIKQKKIVEEFGKSTCEIINNYRDKTIGSTLRQSKSAKVIHKIIQNDSALPESSSKASQRLSKHSEENKHIPKGLHHKRQQVKIKKDPRNMGFK